MSERVSIPLQEGVADIRLTRPDKMNALDDAMFTALIEAGERLKTTPGLRSVVISGEGRAFCAGLDMRGALARADRPASRSARTVSPTTPNRSPGFGARCRFR